MLITRRQFSTLALAFGARPSFGADGAQIDETHRSGIARRKIPAAVGHVAPPEKTLYSGAFGTRDSSVLP